MSVEPSVTAAPTDVPRLDERHQLVAVARPELDERGRFEVPEDRARVFGNEPELSAGDAVPRQPADGLEERGAERVVEVARRQLARLQSQVIANVVRELLSGWCRRERAAARRRLRPPGRPLQAYPLRLENEIRGPGAQRDQRQGGLISEKALQRLTRWPFAGHGAAVRRCGPLGFAQELLSSITNKVMQRARLANAFAELYPLVRVYVANRCFGKVVDIEDEKIRTHLHRQNPRHAMSERISLNR